MSRRILLIYNPKAGKGKFISFLSSVIDRFTKAGYLVETYPTQSAGDAVDHIISMEDDYEMIVPAGGDGTLDETFTALIRSGRDIPVGYIPIGSTNDYAKSLGMPANVPEAVEDIISGKPARVDAGVINGDHIFVYVAAFGAFTQVAYETNQDMKNMFGHVAYIMEATRRLADLKSYLLQVRTAEYETEDEYIFGMITNSVSVGGIMNITGKEVMLNDGLFEVTLIHSPKSIMETQEIIGSLLTQNYDTDLIDYFKTDKIELISDVEIPWTLDGEFGGLHKTVRLENRKQAIQMVLNNSKEHI
ncbi:MAG: diacylglycerol kinase family lipid kinase [Lachnospiraceae bacterium]|nr:diacylglycerol kinase family lipid kinase [Lachnospiraceae bacterium]